MINLTCVIFLFLYRRYHCCNVFFYKLLYEYVQQMSKPLDFDWKNTIKNELAKTVSKGLPKLRFSKKKLEFCMLSKKKVK